MNEECITIQKLKLEIRELKQCLKQVQDANTRLAKQNRELRRAEP
jgi:FtsZ-binding cell division protein ZapB